MNGVSPAARAELALIRFYRRSISPHLPGACRYTPTCSAYAAEAIEAYGALHGGWMALRRILRCNPFHEGGFDPVTRPDRWAGKETLTTLIHGGQANR